MIISKIHIENYKSIKNLDITPSPKLNVIIGENSVGKSNILNAVYWLLGPVYPTFNKTTPSDHYLGKLENKIKIDLEIDGYHRLSLSEEWYPPRCCEPRSGLSLDNSYINNTDREKYNSAYLDVNRTVGEYLPSNKWTLIGRFLQDVNSKFITEKSDNELKSELLKKKLTDIKNELLFSVKNEDGKEYLPEFLNIVSSEAAQQLNLKNEDFKLDLNLYDPWNFYRTLQILIRDNDSNLDFQPYQMGMGIQAALSIGILKAYSELKLANNTPIFIDEPELFLHPQAQRNFYSILRKLADAGTQIFLTTHSPAFVNVGHFDEIFIVRKDSENGTYVRTADPNKFCQDLEYRLGIKTTPNELMEHYLNAYEYTGDTQKANEGFFARKIILVEGESEALILPYFFNLIGFDYVRKNISIVRCGGKSELDRFYRLYSEFGIPCYIIFDGDKQHVEGEKGKDVIEKDIRGNKAIMSLFNDEGDYPCNSVTPNYLGFTTCLEDNLDGHEVSHKKGLRLYRSVKETIKSDYEVPQWVRDLMGAIQNLPDFAKSALISK